MKGESSEKALIAGISGRNDSYMADREIWKSDRNEEINVMKYLGFIES